MTIAAILTIYGFLGLVIIHVRPQYWKQYNAIVIAVLFLMFGPLHLHHLASLH